MGWTAISGASSHVPTIARRALITALALLLAMIIAALALLVLPGSERGTAWLAALARDRLGDTVSWQSLDGSLWNELTVSGISVRQPGISADIDSAALVWNPRALLQGLVEVRSLTLRGLSLTVHETAPDQSPNSETPFQLDALRLPIAVELHGVAVRDMMLLLPGEAPRQVLEIDLDAGFDGDRVTLTTLRARLPEGGVTLSGAATLRESMPLNLEAAADWQMTTGDPATGNLRPVSLAAMLSLDGRLQWGDAIAVDLRYRTELQGLNAVLPEIPDRLVTQGELAARQRDDTLILEDFSLALADSALDLTLEGQLLVAASGDVAFDATLGWQYLRWPLTEEEPAYSSDRGGLSVNGSLDDYRLSADLALGAANLPDSRWQLQATGSQQGASIQQLSGSLLGGSLSLAGPVAWDPLPRWQLSISAQDLALVDYAPPLTGPLAAALELSGHLDPDTGLQTTFDIAHVNTALQGQPLTARGAGRVLGDTVELDGLSIESGANHGELRGALSASALELDWQLAVADPSPFLPGARGRLQGSGRLAGTAESPRLQATLEGSALGLDTLATESLSLDIDAGLAEDAPLQSTLRLKGIADGETSIATFFGLESQGTVADHRIALQADTPSLQLSARLAGGLSLERVEWGGELSALALVTEPLGTWALEQPAGLAVSADTARLETGCLRGPGETETLCLSGGWQALGDSRLQLQVADFDIAALQPSMTGKLRGELAAAIAGDGALAAEGRFDLGSGDILLPDSLTSPSLAHGGGSLTLSAGEAGLDARLDFAAPAEGNLSARISLPELHRLPPAGEQPLNGRLNAALPDLAIAAALIEGIEDSHGRLRADLTAGGSLMQPRIEGNLTLEDGAARLPVAGLELREIRLSAQGDPDHPGALTLTGGLTSGPGQLSLIGAVDLTQGVADLSLRGEQLSAYDTEDARVFLSPDLQLNWREDILRLRGLIQVPRADITPRLRMGTAATESSALATASGSLITPSPDVRVIGEEQRAEAVLAETEAPFRIDAALDLLLGDDVKVNALGLITRVAGGVHFKLTPEQQELLPTAQGIIALEDGTFRSFGQDLDIETGQVIFANVPVTEPEVYLRAVRWIDNDPEVTAAGIEVSGPGTSPQLTLFSRPQLESAEIQSYLLTGGGTGGNNSVLGIGTYLTDRIYVGYGYNLLEQTSEFDSLFSITPHYGLGADVGEADSNFNLTFTHEN